MIYTSATLFGSCHVVHLYTESMVECYWTISCLPLLVILLIYPFSLHHPSHTDPRILFLPLFFLLHVLQIFVEARRTSPSILYIPHIGQWWETVGPALKATFLSLLSSIPAFSPILLIATCNLQYDELSMEVSKDERYNVDWLQKQHINASDFLEFKKGLHTFLYKNVFLMSHSSYLRYRSCFGWSTERFSKSRSPPAEKEETFLRT